jgi:hypothetical protein
LVSDFAVGAYKSGHILIFKTKPIIKLDLTLTVPALMIGQKNFTVTECVSFKGSRVPEKISETYIKKEYNPYVLIEIFDSKVSLKPWKLAHL